MIATSSSPSTYHGISIFTNHADVGTAIQKLAKAGFDMGNLSVIAQEFQSNDLPFGFVNIDDMMCSWGKQGAFWRSTWKTVPGSAYVFLPGLGQTLFAGYVCNSLRWVFMGHTSCIIGGVLSSLGAMEHSIRRYKEYLRMGHVIFIIHGTDQCVRDAVNLVQGKDLERSIACLDIYATR